MAVVMMVMVMVMVMAKVMVMVMVTMKVMVMNTMVSVLGNMLLSKNQENNEDEESVHTNILKRKDTIRTGLSLSLQSVHHKCSVFCVHFLTDFICKTF